FGGRLGPTRGKDLVEQVVGTAFQTFGGEDPHPGAFTKAAMLLRGITTGHSFQDGNKRTGFLLAIFYLESVGHPTTPELPIVAVVTLSRRVSAGKVRDIAHFAHIASELEKSWKL
ncbi:MAG: Fic family protein, partial [Chloroflexota bacterium]|nr:Fic family protein [Chloroflexota bacterium]